MKANLQDLYRSLTQVDFAHLWHPFTQEKVWREEEPLIIESAQGVELMTVTGERLLDGVSSLWCNVHGHGVPEILSALQDQSRQLCHSTLLGLSHRPILELTQALITFLPKELSRVFYADSGSTAVEASLRMCLEWWQRQQSRGGEKKKKFASLVGAYHGDTLGAVGVGFQEDFHQALSSVVVRAEQIHPPHYYRFYKGLSEENAEERSLREAAELFQREGAQIAALIIEPIVQGAAGIWIHSKRYLKELSLLCKRYDIFLIVDEVATGFGKTGKMFAFEHAEITPDVVVVGKGLSGGYLPISAAIATEQIFEGFVGDPKEKKAFFYGQTFAGNPLAASAARASLQLFSDQEVITKVSERSNHFGKELAQYITPLAHVDEVRRFGLMTGIELTKIPGHRVPYDIGECAGLRIVREARKLGAFIRPLGNVMILMPALAMNERDLTRLVQITSESIQRALGEK